MVAQTVALKGGLQKSFFMLELFDVSFEQLG